MLIKNKIKFIIIYLLSFFIFTLNVNADEFNITAKEIVIDKENNILVGKGSVTAKDSEGKIINANKITYEKSREFLLAEGEVKFKDIEGNLLSANKVTYDKINEIITTYDYTELILGEGYKIITKNISYDRKKKILNSNDKSIFTDNDGNKIETSMFQYNIENNLFSSIGKIKIIDIKKHQYFLKELHVDTKKKEMIGSDISVILDQKNFGVNEENDPRFVANDILMSKNKTDLSKGVFTVCKKRDDKKCPPWLLKAKKITHDKLKKNYILQTCYTKIVRYTDILFSKIFSS